MFLGQPSCFVFFLVACVGYVCVCMWGRQGSLEDLERGREEEGRESLKAEDVLS